MDAEIISAASVDAVCFSGRLKFPRSDGTTKSFPAVIFYFGLGVQKFLQTFRKFGTTLDLKHKNPAAPNDEA